MCEAEVTAKGWRVDGNVSDQIGGRRVQGGRLIDVGEEDLMHESGCCRVLFSDILIFLLLFWDKKHADGLAKLE